MTADECIELANVALKINLTWMKKANDVACHLVARCCELYAASHSVCTRTITERTRSSTEALKNLRQEAQKVLTTLLDWLQGKLPYEMSYEGKSLRFADEIKVRIKYAKLHVAIS